MTYNAKESGLQTGNPVEFYEFQSGVDYYRYTSADSDLSEPEGVYSAIPISRTAVEATAEKARSGIKVSVPANAEIASIFNPMPPNNVVVLTIYRRHRNDVDDESIIVWKGRVLNVAWNGQIADLSCESLYTSIKRPGLRRLYQRQCPHVLYSPQCGVQKTVHSFSATVNEVTGTVIGLSTLSVGDGYLGGGYLEWDRGGGITERRAIQSNVGVDVTINFPIIGMPVGALVRIWPGCDHTLSTCNSKFSNADNFGGFPHIPQKNPFAGTPIY